MPKRRANGEGSITKRKDKDGKIVMWQAQYTDKIGERRTLYGKTQQEVKEKLKAAIRESDDGIRKDKSKCTFAEWMQEWLETYHKPTVRASTYAANYNRIHRHIIPAFKNVILKDLDTNMLQKFFNHKAKDGRLKQVINPETNQKVLQGGGLEAQTLMHLKSQISQALEQAVINKMILHDVSQGVKLPPLIRKDVKILTVEEQKKLEKHLLTSKNPYAFALLLDLYTGLRAGELRALRISDINLSKNEIYVQRSLGRVTLPDSKTIRSKIIVNEPKTAKGKRMIPIPSFIIDLLKSYIESRNKRVEVLKELWGDEWVDDGYLFLTSNGTPVESAHFNKVLDAFLKEVGLEHIKLHALRHTFTTRCIEQGFDVRSLADILGHTNVAMTLNVYTHALTEQKKKNMELLSTLFNNELEK